MNKADMRTIAALLLIVAVLPGSALALRAPSTRSTQVACPTVTKTLKIGSQGAEVSALQKYLISQALLPQDAATGYFGAKTSTALKAFQVSKGFKTTSKEFGVTGLETRLHLYQCKLVRALSLEGGGGFVDGRASSGISAHILTPNGGEDFFEGSTTTITYTVTGLSPGANPSDYRIEIGVVSSSGTELGSLAGASLSGGSLPLPFYRDMADAKDSDNVVRLRIFKSERSTTSPAVRSAAEALGIDMTTQQIQLPVQVLVAADESDKTFVVHGTSDALLDYKADNYKSDGAIVLGVGNEFDVWGGRFIIRLDRIENNVAYFSSFIDSSWPTRRDPSESFKVSLNGTTKFTMTGQDTFANVPPRKFGYSGEISYMKAVGAEIGAFSIKMYGGGPDEIKAPVVTPVYKDGFKAVKQDGATMYFDFRVNTDKDCSKTPYTFTYGDGKSMTIKVPADRCASNYTMGTVYGYKAGTYTATLSRNAGGASERVQSETFTMSGVRAPIDPSSPKGSAWDPLGNSAAVGGALDQIKQTLEQILRELNGM